jgi:hypothetical protein
MSWSGGTTVNSSKNIRKFINHWYLESLIGIQLIQLHTVDTSFSDDYRLGDILQFITIQGGKLYGLLSTSTGTLCLLNQSILRMTSMPFESKRIRLATKSTLLILRFNLWHIVFRIHLF